MTNPRYVGNLPESQADHYKNRTYTHSTHHGNQVVKWYDCWVEEKTENPYFGENETPNPAKITRLEKIVRWFWD